MPDEELMIETAEHARAAGFPPALVLEPARGFHPWRDRRDGRRLVRYLAEQRFDVVHAFARVRHCDIYRTGGGSGGSTNPNTATTPNNNNANNANNAIIKE